MRIARSLISATLVLGGISATVMPVFAQAPAALQPAQNAAPPAVPISPPGGAQRSFADLTERLVGEVVNV